MTLHNILYVAVIQLDDKDEPLPKPFKFPKFPLETQKELQSGVVTAKLLRAVARYTAHAMYAYARNVSKEERERVAKELVNQYPILKSPNKARPYVSSANKPAYDCVLVIIPLSRVVSTNLRIFHYHG